VLDHRIITAPDLDATNCFKIMLIDFDWATIAAFSEIVQRVPESVTVYIYGENDSDHAWAINAAHSADAILVNTDRKGKIELLKGHLLSMHRSEAFGSNDQSIFARNRVFDLAEWLTRQISRSDRDYPIRR
jgi:hypothetical protein